MTFNQLKMAVYATVLTNYYGFRLKNVFDHKIMKKARVDYATKLLKSLNISVKTVNPEKLPQDGKYLLISNHRSVIDPLIVEKVTEHTGLFGYWIAKKELYNSFFFGSFTRNAGTVLIDRDSKQMAGFFSDVKMRIDEGASICVFPEGTRNTKGTDLEEFKEGSRLMAIKNRMQILPVYIKGHIETIVREAIKNPKAHHVIEVEVGDLIDPKDKSMSLDQAYRKMFGLPVKEA